MGRHQRQSARAASAKPVETPRLPWPRRWYGQLTLLLLSVGLLTLAFAPLGQFYLAWIGLVPYLIVVAQARTLKRVFFLTWLAGAIFFTLNMWWMWYVSGPGVIALVIYCGLYWGLPAWIIRGCGLIDLPKPFWGFPRIALRVLLVACVWTALEWARGTFLTGLPWLYLGYTQTPILAMCQIADFAGVYGVSFWLVAVNTLAAFWLLEGRSLRRLRPALVTVAGMVAAAGGYGAWRWAQTDSCTSAGPVVMLVQPDFPQDNTGNKSGGPEVWQAFHCEVTTAGIHDAQQEGQKVDLVVWSETSMRSLNVETRHFFQELYFKATVMAGPGNADVIDYYKRMLNSITAPYDLTRSLARQFHTSMLVGATYEDQWGKKVEGKDLYYLPRDKRNSAYLIDPAGDIVQRYDKIHLVPFGEFIPFKQSMPWLFRLFLWLGPYHEDYTLTPGQSLAPTIFTLPSRENSTRPARFVTPICFEDLDASLVAWMFRPQAPSDVKRADFIVNITNDGWFKANEPAQHLQAALFRSIENRVPTARSVNTGISAFVDSFGRITGQIPKGQEGTLAQAVKLDSRLTWYSRYGNLFVLACAVLTALLVAATMAQRLGRPRKAEASGRD